MSRTRRGNVVTTVLMLPVLMAVGSLSVDIGQAYTARAQLQAVTDLAARSAVDGLDGSQAGMAEAAETAIRIAGLNEVGGGAVALDAGDIATGTWGSDGEERVFVASTDPDVVDALQITARSEVSTFFASMILGVQSMSISAEAVAVAETGGAAEVPCFLPLAVPDCALEDPGAQGFEFTLSPAGIDNVGWARFSEDGSPSAAWASSQILNCDLSGTARVGDEIWLDNGVKTSAMGTLADLVESSPAPWDATVYGAMPAQLPHSAIGESAYGGVVEGVILVFEGTEDYCAGEGGWNERSMPLVGFAWGAVYDVVTTGPAAGKTIRMKVDLDREHLEGLDVGGEDFGVTAVDPALVR